MKIYYHPSNFSTYSNEQRCLDKIKSPKRLMNNPDTRTLIANPIYDVSFKYLLADSRIAKLLLSAIIAQEIVAIELRPQEQTAYDPERGLTVFRVDFAARIKTEEGEKTVIIEIQKAKFAADIMRFRRYLGENYSNQDHVYLDPVTNEYRPTPIISIYLLGYKLESTSAPIIHVNRRYVDVATGQELTGREAFIESLTHDSYIIQIPCLKGRRRTELERVLAIFDQSTATSRDRHVLEIYEDEVPERFREVVRRLQRAAAETSIRRTMYIEDEVIGELEKLERKVIARDMELESKDKELQLRDEELQSKDQEIQSKLRELQSKDELLQVREHEIREQKLKLAEQERMLAELKKGSR